jgi:hypothetical protein
VKKIPLFDAAKIGIFLVWWKNRVKIFEFEGRTLNAECRMQNAECRMQNDE